MDHPVPHARDLRPGTPAIQSLQVLGRFTDADDDRLRCVPQDRVGIQCPDRWVRVSPGEEAADCRLAEAGATGDFRLRLVAHPANAIQLLDQPSRR
ncbi:MAG: hypothetical protein HYR89_06610 [Actinobacteria bacterium]|nr:hypothetical protein [Actinomycetota bacterium]